MEPTATQRKRPTADATTTAPHENNKNSNHNSQDDDGGWDRAVQEHLRIHSSTGKAGFWNNSTGVMELRLIRQRNNWDCGIACLQMALHWLQLGRAARTTAERDNHIPTATGTHCCQKDEYEWMLQQVGTRSIWTVDLVLLLDQILTQQGPYQQPATCAGACARFLFATQRLYANEDWASLQFYAAAFAEDRVRIDQAFRLLKQKGLPVFQMPGHGLSMQHVVRVLADENCVAIMLVDNNILKRQRHGGNCDATDYSHDDNRSAQCYVGHYLFLAGAVQLENHHHPRTMMVVFNPACADDGPTLVDIGLLELAWQSPGTDQDVIVIARSHISS